RRPPGGRRRRPKRAAAVGPGSRPRQAVEPPFSCCEGGDDCQLEIPRPRAGQFSAPPLSNPRRTWGNAVVSRTCAHVYGCGPREGLGAYLLEASSSSETCARSRRLDCGCVPTTNDVRADSTRI